MSDNKIETEISRQRRSPKLWDFSFLMLRNNIEVFLQFKNLFENEKKQKLLDVGCGFKPWAAFFEKGSVEYIGVDYDKNLSSADMVAPANKLPFEDNTFDGMIYSEVLEHVDDLAGALKEMRRVAKPNALVFISTPFMFPEHGIPHDYQRLTRYFYEKTFGQHIIVLSESNSSLSTSITSLNLFIESTPFRIFYGLKHLIYIFLNLLGMLGDGIVNLFFGKSKYFKYFYLMPLGYALIVRINK